MQLFEVCARHRSDRGTISVRLIVLSAVSLVVVAALTLTHLSSSEPPARQPKVTRVLDKLARDGEDRRPRVGKILDRLAAGRELKAADKGDSPTKGTRAAATRGIAVPKDLYSPLGTMTIRSIGLKTPFFNGVFDEIVEEGPGHWPGTPLPGAPGNAAFAGHRTTYTHPFGDLDLLKPGDVVVTKIGRNDPVRFKVFRTTIVPEAEYADFVLKQPERRKARLITLFACHPKGYRTHRIVVQAKAPPLSEQQEDDAPSNDKAERRGT